MQNIVAVNLANQAVFSSSSSVDEKMLEDVSVDEEGDDEYEEELRKVMI
jgi:hypothetical protein